MCFDNKLISPTDKPDLRTCALNPPYNHETLGLFSWTLNFKNKFLVFDASWLNKMLLIYNRCLINHIIIYT